MLWWLVGASAFMTQFSAWTFTGAAGIDWANVEGPTSTVGLTNTTVGTATAVTNAVTVGTINSAVITAASIATDAIGAAELATDAVEEIADQVWDEVLSGATHNVVNSAGRRLRFLQEAGSYVGAIWQTAVWTKLGRFLVHLGIIQ